jgi:nucleoside-diphosphate-sugar epimerase
MDEAKHIILGATGFLGSKVLRHLEKTNMKVLGYSKSNDTKNYNTTVNQLEIRKESIQYVQINEEDVIYDCIGLKTKFYGMNISDFQNHSEELIEYYIKLCEHVENRKAKKLVIISSAGALYNANSESGRIITENSPPHIIDGYGAATKVLEETLQKSKLYSSGKIVILRPTNVFGSDQTYKNNQGLIPKAIEALKNGREIPLIIDKFVKRDYLYIDDFIKAIDHITLKNGIFNVSSEEMKSNVEVILAVGEIMMNLNIEGNIKPIKREESNYSPLKISSEKIRKETNWAPSWKFNDAIYKTVKDYLAHK